MTAAEKKIDPALFSLDTLAARWETSVKTVRRYVWSGKLKAKRLGPRCIRVPLAEVQRFEASLRDA
jgi:hypothetical protein